MTVTSFDGPRRRLGPKAWRILHKGGVHGMWLAVWGTYTATLLVVEDPPVVAWGYSATGVAAWMLRVAAFAKKRTTGGGPLSL